FATAAHQEVRLWDLTGRSLLPPLPADPEFVNCVAFSPDGKYLATVGHTGIVKIWDVTSGEEVRSFKEGPQINAVAFHPTGKYVASGGADGRVRLWDHATGDEIHPPPLRAHVPSSKRGVQFGQRVSRHREHERCHRLGCEQF